MQGGGQFIQNNHFICFEANYKRYSLNVSAHGNGVLEPISVQRGVLTSVSAHAHQCIQANVSFDDGLA